VRAHHGRAAHPSPRGEPLPPAPPLPGVLVRRWLAGEGDGSFG
jgi:hypothetical protein